MFQSKKGFTLIELLIGIAVMSILLSTVVKVIIPYTKTYIKEKQRVTGKIYTLAHDIEINKLNTKKSEVLNNGKSLRLFTSKTCYSTYTFNEQEKEINKINVCSQDEMDRLYRTFNIPNIDYAFFSKEQKTIYLNIKEKGQDYSHSFVF